jgi:spore coat protein CotH
MHKDAGGKIKMGPLWDFDCGYGYEDTFTFFREYKERIPNFSRRNGYAGQPFFQRFFADPSFRAKYKARWNEKYADIASIAQFIDTMYNRLRNSQDLNGMRWYSSYYYRDEIKRMRTWWNNRVIYLNEAINSE